MKRNISHCRLRLSVVIALGAFLSCAGIAAARKDSGIDVFYAKHKPAAGELLKKKHVHAPVLRNTCSTCHASAADPLKLSAEGNALCFSCHSAMEKSLKKKNVHAPFSGMPCTTCHSPHSSDNEAVLVSPVKDLCSMCHDVSGEKIRKGHSGIKTLEADCTLCHNAHASDNGKLLLEGKTHPSFEPGGCDTCHDQPRAPGESAGAKEDGSVKLKGGGNELCLMCHADKKDDQKKKTVHPPFLSGACEKCHFPHILKTRAFTSGRPEDVCRRCHDKILDNGHPVVGHKSFSAGKPNPLDKSKPFDCVSCHNPHASDFKKLRVSEPGEFCMACHEQ